MRKQGTIPFLSDSILYPLVCPAIGWSKEKETAEIKKTNQKKNPCALQKERLSCWKTARREFQNREQFKPVAKIQKYLQFKKKYDNLEVVLLIAHI